MMDIGNRKGQTEIILISFILTSDWKMYTLF